MRTLQERLEKLGLDATQFVIPQEFENRRHQSPAGMIKMLASCTGGIGLVLPPFELGLVLAYIAELERRPGTS